MCRLHTLPTFIAELVLVVVTVPFAFASTNNLTPPLDFTSSITAQCINATDCTDELQRAIASGAGEVVIPKLPNNRSWILRPLDLYMHQVISLEEGVELLAKRDEFHSKWACLLNAEGVSNVTIQGMGAGGATLRMRRADYANATPPLIYSKAEWRAGINVFGVDGFTVRNMRITETGGDGIQIASCSKGACLTDGSRNASYNVLVEDCIIDHNYRQGISVISAVNLTVRNTTLSYTGVPWGTAPRAGVDIEPDVPSHAMSNILFENVRSIGNMGSGFSIYARKSDNITTPPISIKFDRCIVDGTGQGGFDIGAISEGVGVGGAGVVVQGCSVRNTTAFGLSVFDKAASATTVRVIDTTFTLTATNTTIIAPCPPEYKKLHKCTNDTITKTHPLGLFCGIGPKHPAVFPIGGLTLENVTVNSREARDFMFLSCQTGFVNGGVDGDVTVAMSGTATKATACRVPAPAVATLAVDCL